MRIARIAATMTAAGVLVLAGASPVFAADPVGSVDPTTIEVEGGFTATLTGCDADEASIQTDLLEGPSEALDKDAADGTFSKTFAGTDKDAKPGAHKVAFLCGDDPAGSAMITVTAPEPEPKFDADITPKVFTPGDRLTLTTTGCPTLPTVQDVNGLFTGPLVLKEVGDQKHQGSAVTKTGLSPTKTYRVVVTCKDVGSFTFSAVPGKKTTKHRSGQTGVVPVGGVQTGDGSSLGGGTGSAALPMAAGATAAVALTALALAYRRRKAREDA
jgi:hypothetical protein